MVLEMESLRQEHALAAQAWGAEKSELLAQLAQVKAQLSSAEATLQNTQATLSWTEDQLSNHQQSLEEVLNSASWKLTKPLRVLGGN